MNGNYNPHNSTPYNSLGVKPPGFCGAVVTVGAAVNARTSTVPSYDAAVRVVLSNRNIPGEGTVPCLC